MNFSCTPRYTNLTCRFEIGEFTARFWFVVAVLWPIANKYLKRAYNAFLPWNLYRTRNGNRKFEGSRRYIASSIPCTTRKISLRITRNDSEEPWNSYCTRRRGLDGIYLAELFLWQFVWPFFTTTYRNISCIHLFHLRLLTKISSNFIYDFKNFQISQWLITYRKPIVKFANENSLDASYRLAVW